MIIITGPTASGKTDLAIKLAKQFNGEIISADSRSIYRGINIASAKPIDEEMKGIVHWGFDLVDPGERFTAADFKQYAYTKIDDILARKKVPFIVGGTGLYIDAVLYDYKFKQGFNESQREVFNNMSVAELVEYCNNNDIDLPENSKNKRYLIRSIETKSEDNTNKSREKNNIYNFSVVGISTDRDILRGRISNRAEQFFRSGVIDEAIKLSEEYGWQSEAMTANAYPLIHQYLDQKISYDEMIKKYTTQDWRLAKRQITFMKRNKDIKWLDLERAEVFLSSLLAGF